MEFQILNISKIVFHFICAYLRDLTQSTTRDYLLLITVLSLLFYKKSFSLISKKVNQEV